HRGRDRPLNGLANASRSTNGGDGGLEFVLVRHDGENSKSETRNSKPETETRNSRPETRNPKSRRSGFEFRISSFRRGVTRPSRRGALSRRGRGVARDNRRRGGSLQF